MTGLAKEVYCINQRPKCLEELESHDVCTQFHLVDVFAEYWKCYSILLSTSWSGCRELQVPGPELRSSGRPVEKVSASCIENLVGSEISWDVLQGLKTSIWLCMNGIKTKSLFIQKWIPHLHQRLASTPAHMRVNFLKRKTVSDIIPEGHNLYLTQSPKYGWKWQIIDEIAWMRRIMRKSYWDCIWKGKIQYAYMKQVFL